MSDLPHLPWTLHDTGSAFVVRDNLKRGIAYVYYKRDPALWGSYLKPEEARALAIKVAQMSKASDR